MKIKPLGCFSLFLLLISTLTFALSTDQTILLKTPKMIKGKGLDTLLQQRRSIRSFSNKPLSQTQIAKLLWAGQGVTDQKTGFRAAPSAGALYPLILYVINENRVWQYQPEKKSLILLQPKSIKTALKNASYQQKSIEDAAVNIVIVANYAETAKKYRNQAAHFVDMEAGHVAQNILLEAENLNLGAVPIGGFNQNAVQKLLKLPEHLTPIYIIAVGNKR